MAMPMNVKDLAEDGKALSGERYLGMEVYAYDEPNEYNGNFSKHWSTPSKHNKVVRLFDENQIIALFEKLKNIPRYDMDHHGLHGEDAYMAKDHMGDFMHYEDLIKVLEGK